MAKDAALYLSAVRTAEAKPQSQGVQYSTSSGLVPASPLETPGLAPAPGPARWGCRENRLGTETGAAEQAAIMVLPTLHPRRHLEPTGLLFSTQTLCMSEAPAAPRAGPAGSCLHSATLPRPQLMVPEPVRPEGCGEQLGHRDRAKTHGRSVSWALALLPRGQECCLGPLYTPAPLV